MENTQKVSVMQAHCCNESHRSKFIYRLCKERYNRLHGAGQDTHTASGLSGSLAHFILVSVSAAVWDQFNDWL